MNGPTTLAVLACLVALCHGVAEDHGVAGIKCYPPQRYLTCGDLGCNATSNQCEECVLNDNCFFPSAVCVPVHGEGSSKCEMQAIYEMHAVRTVLATVGTLVVSILSVLGGVSGGTALTPLYALAMGLPPPAAAEASLATILGQSVINVAVLVRQPHPERPRSKINYAVLANWYPVTVLGAIVGNIVAPALLPWFRAFFLVLLFGGVAFVVITRRDHERVDGDLLAAYAPSDTSPLGVPSTKFPESIRYWYPKEVFSLAVCVAVGAMSYAGSYYSECGKFRWSMFIVGPVVMLMLLFVIWTLQHLITIQRARRRLVSRTSVHYGDRPQDLLLFPATTMIAGFAASTVGTGGGSVITPVLIEAGLGPEEAAATGGVATGLIALQATIGAFAAPTHALRNQWIGFFVFLGMVSAAIARWVVVPFLRRREIARGPLLALIGVLVLQAGLVVAFAAVQMYYMVHFEIPFAFGTICRGG